MENIYPKPNVMPPFAPSAVSPAMHHPYPQVNVFDIEQKHIDNIYLAPAHIKAHPMPVAAAPIYHHPVRPRCYSDVGIILVLFILLVIISRTPFFGGKF